MVAFQPRLWLWLSTNHVAVSRGLVESVSSDELAAVLHHERYHVANYDPLKVVLARSLPDSLFFLPALGELRGRYVAGRELAADRRAMTRSGAPSVAGPRLCARTTARSSPRAA